MKIKNGFTLIELLMALAIVAILVGMALPAFNDLLDRQKVKSNVQRLVQVLQTSRLKAITFNTHVTICPKGTVRECGSDWSAGFLSFVDKNGNRKIDSEDELLQEFNNTDERSKLTWRAFGVQNSLQWLPTGITNHQNGTFELCYGDKNENARGLFLTKAGRVRYSKDTDGNGIHENATGADLNC